ncbi:hypothetical protein GCM10012286_39430 [Streptomyces lasiicapitis]|uniref:Uncharacterized protein n=1 Tax=Streptomyces lasiicapitis TaxID=1923961 RepID=A0ABQ2M889_9ACTN|nr:hypothetical protein GCM10012286_39430 [Streptomyces lasiicapitis]
MPASGSVSLRLRREFSPAALAAGRWGLVAQFPAPLAGGGLRPRPRLIPGHYRRISRIWPGHVPSFSVNVSVRTKPLLS